MQSVGSKAWQHVRSNVVGYIALFFALGSGTAMAANTVFSTDIVNGEVKSVDIQSNGVASVDLLNGGVETQDLLDEDVKSQDLDNGSVRTSEIQNAAIQEQDLADGAVSPAKHGVGLYVRMEGVSTDTLACPSVPNNTETPIPFEFTDYDSAEMWGGDVTPTCAEASKLYAPRDGVYAISGGLFDDGTTGDRYLGIQVNSGQTIAATRDVTGGGALIQNVSAEVDLDEGDYVELVLEHTQGAPVEHNYADERNFFAMSWVGPLSGPALSGASATPRAEGALRD